MIVLINKVGPLSNSIDYHFSTYYTKDTLSLVMQGYFSEAVFHRDSSAILYNNTNIVSMKIPKNTMVSDVSLWSYNERLTPKDPEVVDCYFGTTHIVPTIAWGMDAGLNMLQCVTLFLLLGELIYITPISDSDLTVMTDCYSVLSPFAPGHGDLKKFVRDAVHVNIDDHITPQ